MEKYSTLPYDVLNPTCTAVSAVSLTRRILGFGFGFLFFHSTSFEVSVSPLETDIRVQMVALRKDEDFI